jgi:hypothetical protein
MNVARQWPFGTRLRLFGDSGFCDTSTGKVYTRSFSDLAFLYDYWHTSIKTWEGAGSGFCAETNNRVNNGAVQVS